MLDANLKLTKLQRLKVLIKKGFFPAELPPVFHCNDFSKYAGFLEKSWDEDQIFSQGYHKCRYERYSYPRYDYLRRNLAIVNPVPQFFLSKEIADNWIKIRRFIKESAPSLTPPLIAEGLSRAIIQPDFEQVSEKKISIKAHHNYTVSSDISRFYPTLYTHVIPWALHGKSWSKRNLGSASYKTSTGARLDTFVRATQENQTIGIPIGPDSSRILSEIVAVAIEANVKRQINFSEQSYFRNVDDVFFGTDTRADADAFVTTWTQALQEYELQVNYEKTSVGELELPEQNEWAFELSHFIAPSKVKSRSRIEHFFDIAFNHARKHPKSNVLLYAVRSSTSLKVTQRDWNIYEDLILRAARLNPTVLPALTEILFDKNMAGFPVDLKKISKLVNDIISTGITSGHLAEISWALFIARGLKIKIPMDLSKKIVHIKSSVCALLFLDMRNRGLVPKSVSTRFWESFMTSSGLRSDMWLLAYEAHIKGWLHSSATYVDDDHYFSCLKAKKVSFYDETKNIKKLEFRRSKLLSEHRIRIYLRQLFQNDSLL